MTNYTPKRVDLTLEQKTQIINYKNEYRVLTHDKIAQHFTLEWNIRVVRSTVSGILRSDMEILK